MLNTSPNVLPRPRSVIINTPEIVHNVFNINPYCTFFYVITSLFTCNNYTLWMVSLNMRSIFPYF